MEILNSIAQETLSKAALELLRLSLSGDPSQQELDDFLAGWDIEAAPIAEPILMSYVMKMHPELVFPEAIRPRLNGLISFCRYQFLNLVGHFGSYTRALQAEGIDFLIMKGGAMKALRPEFPRWMGDIDILVREKDYEKAEEVAARCGFTISHSIQSMDLSKNGQGLLDVHRYVLIFTGKERAINEDLFARSVPTRVFSVEAHMPSREDLLFLILVNMVRNLADASGQESVLYSFFDVKYLMEPQDGRPFNWDRVRQTAVRTGAQVHLMLAARFLNGVMPGLFPEDKLENPGEAAVSRLEVWVGYRRYVLMKERAQINGEYNVVKAIRGGRPFFPYMALRARFFVHKRLQFCTGITRHILKRYQ